jgi:reductive dehalogenase
MDWSSLSILVFRISVVLISLFCGYAAIVSFIEKEIRAFSIFLVCTLFFSVLFIFILTFNISIYLVVTADILFVSLIILFFLPGKSKALVGANPIARIDERLIMFSRSRLIPGSKRYRDYYAEFPDHLENDKHFRSLPGLLSSDAPFFNEKYFYAALNNFSTVETLHNLVDGPSVERETDVDPVEMTKFISSWVEKMGAHSHGVTKLHDYHKYSVVGRGDDYGKKVELNHTYAFAFTVEMDKNLMDAAPMAPVVFESSQQYLRSGLIAVQVAEWIRTMGYDARAHIDGNYRVVCPLVARDAGLGEIGRMGLLMTPKLGPRVRIAVVTTDMPLVISNRNADPSVEDFCDVCKKCANTCPSAAIPKDAKREIDGVLRWQIDQEKCYSYWCRVGTDCGKCMRLCPYSHPDNLLHNVVRYGIKHSQLFRKFAVWMDDFVYGKNPKPRLPKD